MLKNAGTPRSSTVKARRATDASGKGGGSIQGYFRPIFKENPRLLKIRSNESLYERWLRDHPGEKEVPVRVRQGLANLKSVLRNRRRRRRRLRQEESGSAPNGGVSAVGLRSSTRGSTGLTRLEAQIDEALILAKQLDPTGLDDVIRLLRTARNRVVVRLG